MLCPLFDCGAVGNGLPFGHVAALIVQPWNILVWVGVPISPRVS